MMTRIIKGIYTNDDILHSYTDLKEPLSWDAKQHNFVLLVRMGLSTLSDQLDDLEPSQVKTNEYEYDQ